MELKKIALINMEGEETFNIVLSENVPEGFTLVVGFPGIGLTGFLAVENILSKCEMKEIGFIDAKLVPPAIVIVENEPKHPIGIFMKDKIVIIKSEVPVINDCANRVGETIIKWAETMKVNRIIILDGLPTPGRIPVNERTVVWGVSSKNEGVKVLETLEVKPILRGMIMGVASILFMESKKRGIDCYGLFGESFAEVPDMRAAASVICKFSKLTSIPLEINDLLNTASEFEHSYAQQYSQISGDYYNVSNVNLDSEKSSRPSMYG